MASKSVQQQSFTTINEPIKLSKKQNEILTMVCDLYEMKIGEYIKEALIESLKEEITDGEFRVLLASKLDDNKKENRSKTGSQNPTLNCTFPRRYNFVYMPGR
jgi:myosin-crossreactive antigen